MATQVTTDDKFEQDILQSKGLVLVDFWAQWCGPCKSLGPKLEEISEDRAEDLKIFKVDVDTNQKSPANYGVRGIPAMVLFKDGVEVEQLVGNQSKENILSFIDKNK